MLRRFAISLLLNPSPINSITSRSRRVMRTSSSTWSAGRASTADQDLREERLRHEGRQHLAARPPRPPPPRAGPGARAGAGGGVAGRHPPTGVGEKSAPVGGGAPPPPPAA